jgi:short-subunit dehydrogenase
MKTIFITGASSGVGKATAELFANKSWNVIATMRNIDKAGNLAKFPNVTLMGLDVTNTEQINKVAQEAIALGDIDIVFNNAGYGLAGPLESTSDEEMLNNINTNLLGVIRVTKAFLPHLRAKKNGLILTTTSIGGTIATPFNSIYHAAKFGVEGWSESMDLELRKMGIGIKTIAPGGIKSDFAGSLKVTKHDAYAEHFDKLLFAMFEAPGRDVNYSTPEMIAEVVYEAATDGKQQLRYFAGEDAKAFHSMQQEMGYEKLTGLLDQMFFGE